jgi:acetate kinase
VRAIRHYLGAFLLSLGGLDVITFSGGIGENSALIRRAVLKDLSAFGIECDQEKNASLQGEGAISNHNSAVKILVIPANEELIIARDTMAVVSRANAAAQPLVAQTA